MDDRLVEGTRGHMNIALGDGEEAGFDGEGLANRGDLDPTECRRWRALRKYVREWARQMLQRDAAEGVNGGGLLDPHRAWGLPARRGSWGL